MPRTVTIEQIIYEFEELDEKAKTFARNTYREQPYFLQDDWWEFGDLVECAACLGIRIDTRKEGKFGGVDAPHISFDLGNGGDTQFQGDYEPKADAVEAIKEHAPLCTGLHEIAERLIAQQVATKMLWGDTLEAECTIGGRLGRLNVAVMAIDRSDSSIGNQRPGCGEEDTSVTDEEEGVITEILRDFCRWMHCQLQDQHDYQYSDECIDQYLEEQQFNEDGSVI